MRRGMWGAIRAFDNVRVQVGAMAVGTATAVHEYVRERRRQLTGAEAAQLEAARARIEATRDLLYRAAAEVDADRGRGHLASLAKLEAVALVRRATAVLPRVLGPGALLEHPLLEKWRRDAMGMEFMEGTSDIQRLNVAQGYLRRGIAA
jgi:alkylation response protein AidB-like acyl-CoA dehydrogenase